LKVNRPEREAANLHASIAEVKNGDAMHPPIGTSSWICVKLFKHLQSFTFPSILA
jgi:hypothetical protein